MRQKRSCIKIKNIFIFSFVFLFTFYNGAPSDAAGSGDEIVKSNSSPLVFSRIVHDPSKIGELEGEKFNIFASMYFWQAEAKKLAIFRPNLQSYLALESYPFTPLEVKSDGTAYTIGGKCSAVIAGMSSCSAVIEEKIGSKIYDTLPSPGYLDNHELRVDNKGNFWAIRYLDYPANYFPELFRNSRTSELASYKVDRVSDCEIVRFDRSGNINYRWSALSYLPQSELRDLVWKQNPTGVVKTGNDGLVYTDLFHCNSIDVNNNEKSFLISARHTDSIYEIDIESKNVNWKLGGNYWKGKSLKVIQSPKVQKFSNVLFSGQHDARYVNSNQVSVFDNSTNLKRPARGILFKINSKDRSASIINNFSDPSGSSSGCTGSFRKIIGKKIWFVAGWGCSASGITVFDAQGGGVVSLNIAEVEENDSFRPIIPIANTRSMISYRVTPHNLNFPLKFP